MKKAKLTLKIVLTSVVSILLLTSMLLSTMLGSVNAALVKSLSKKLDFEIIPDLSFGYYLKDNVNTSGKTGAYMHTRNISQSITTLSTPGNTLYRIKVPAEEVGYYTLSFKVDFWDGNDDRSEFFVRTLDTPVGCQVLHAAQLPYNSTKIYSMAPDDATNNGYVYGAGLLNSTAPLLNAKDHYQWKTLAPSRIEAVDLTYSVNADDVAKGYVTWVWDFNGLVASKNYTLKLTDISIVKLEPNDTTKPYFEFMNTQYVNNTIAAYSNQAVPGFSNVNYANGNTSSGVVPSGYTRPNPARGTYVTNGTYNSLTMQASPIYVGWDSTYVESKNLWPHFITGGANGNKYSDLIVLNVPIKNIKKNVSYRVSFDFSVARQGDYNNLPDNGTKPSSAHTTAIAAADANYSSTYNQMFNETDPNGTLHFQSYLHNGPEKSYNITDITSGGGRSQVSTLNKRYGMHWLTRYDEIMSVGKSNGVTTCSFTTASANGAASHATVFNRGTVGEYGAPSYTYTLNGETKTGVRGGEGINWLNAVRHYEVNGDNKINWLTFYNTSFTFNIDPNDADVTVGSDGYCNNLFWTWTIDAFDQTAWFRIKLDNVRIEEVVQYGSFFEAKGLSIGGAQCTDFFPNGTSTNIASAAGAPTTGTILGGTYRSANGTGQNFGPRGYVTQILSATNIFGASYDAGDRNINGDYTVKLTGYCAVDGGVEKYVWSADGGKTWHDMVGGTVADYNGSKNQNTIATYCEKFVDQAFVGRVDNTSTYVQDAYDSNGYSVNSIYTHRDGRYDYIDFQKGSDNLNTKFTDMTADLSEYRYQRDLDIIFAAVPRSNPLLRCEILRIMNYNSAKNYRSYTTEYISDVEVLSSGNKLNATCDALNGEANILFTYMYGRQVGSGKSALAGGYARVTETSRAYDDVRTLFSDFPIKTSLRTKGWAIVERGVEKYMWSVDGGKNWSDVWLNSTLASPSIPTQQREDWYDGSDSTDSVLSTNSSFDLTVDLSKYIGEVVDIIVAAKPNDSDALCPVGRIDNVAVYGDPDATDVSHRGMGPFYSRLQSVALDSVTLNSQITKGLDNSTYLNGGSIWSPTTMLIHESAYTAYEPYNINPLNARSYNNVYNTVSRGGSVKIDGFIGCQGGVEKFKYTFDGEKWYDINLQSQDVISAGADIVTAIRRSADVTYSESEDVALSDFRDSHAFTFNLPQDVTGKKDLIVVAQSTKGYDYPILRIKLDITDTLTVNTDGTAKLQLPVTEVGTYNLNYSSYSHFEVPSTTRNATYGSYMTASNTVCKQGETVSVNYNAGTKNVVGFLAWVGHYNVDTQSDGGYVYLTANSGVYTIDTSNLLGVYKIYFVDANGTRGDTSKYLAEPITLVVLNDEVFKPCTKSSTLGTNHALTLEKRVFTVGEKISYKVDGNIYHASLRPWVAITHTNSYEYKDWSWADVANDPIATTGLAAGRYKIYYLVGNGSTVTNSDSKWFVYEDVYLIDNNSLHTATVSGTVNGTALPTFTQSSLPYGNKVDQDITVTEEDVARGYVEIDYSLTGLPLGSTSSIIIKDLNFVKK